MSFREKSAWITIVTYALVFGSYFLTLWRMWGDGPDQEAITRLIIGSVVTLVILSLTLEAIISAFNPKEADAPADEREALIDLKAERIASYALSIGVVCLIGALLKGSSGVLVAVLLQAAMVVSELIKAGAQIAYFRRGA